LALVALQDSVYPAVNDEMLQNAWRLHQAGNLLEAARLYHEVLRADPTHFHALQLLGFVHFQRGEFEDAERMMDRALSVNPKSLDALYNRGCALQALERHEEALECFGNALAVNPDFAPALINRGNSLSRLQRYDDALASYDKALSLQPGSAETLLNRGNALLELKRPEEALSSYDKALALEAQNAVLWSNRGGALADLSRHREALESFDKALKLEPDCPAALENRANALIKLDRDEEARAALDAALKLEPNNADVLSSRANAHSNLKHFPEAIADCEAALRIDEEHVPALSVLIHCRIHACDWRALKREKAKVAAGLRLGLRTILPLDNKAISDSEEEHLLAARLWLAVECLPSPKPLWRGEKYRHDRIRVAYLSSDLRAHAVGLLTVGALEHHDKVRFETTAISFCADDKSDIRARMAAAFDQFIDVREMSDPDVAALLKRMEVDIAVDLNGYTGDARTRILALRPAPIQVNYLGYPGSMGADYIDYILADRIVIPEHAQRHYTEKVVYLPDSYLPNDSAHSAAKKAPSRAEAGLPASGFVFCSFNNSHKFSPEIFDVWMRLLSEVEGAVLWLPEGNEAARRNLRREAEARGVNPRRLVFATYVKAPEDHRARLALADIFLDTLPYNAHSTACDALWAGLPVLTCRGASFAGRVGASLLNAAELPELIADSLAAYEELALRLACDAPMLAAIKAKLGRNRESCPLFDTRRFTNHLEAAFTQMWERHQRGLPPESFAVTR